MHNQYTASTGKEHSMSLFKTLAELTQESRYTRSKKKNFNVSSANVLKSDMECSFPVDAVVKDWNSCLPGV